MLGHKRRDLLDPVIRSEERSQADCPIKDLVEFINVGHAFDLSQGEKLLVESFRRYRHFTRSHRVADRQRRLVLDRLGDGVLVEIPQLIVGAENLERALALGRLVDGRAGEPDDRRIGQGRHQVRAQILGYRPVRLVDEHVDIVAGIGVLLDTLELVDHRKDQAALVGLKQFTKFGLGAGTPHCNILLLHLA